MSVTCEASSVFLQHAFPHAEFHGRGKSSMSQPGFPMMRSPLNEEKKEGTYGNMVIFRCDAPDRAKKLEEVAFTTRLLKDRALHGLSLLGGLEIGRNPILP